MSMKYWSQKVECGVDDGERDIQASVLLINR
jgi:hypothetical protein